MRVLGEGVSPPSWLHRCCCGSNPTAAYPPAAAAHLSQSSRDAANINRFLPRREVLFVRITFLFVLPAPGCMGGVGGRLLAGCPELLLYPDRRGIEFVSLPEAVDKKPLAGEVQGFGARDE